MNGAELGELIQSYTRVRWGSGRNGREADRLGASLDRDLRDRIDLLGIDAEQLLSVDSDQVLSELRSLEKEGIQEDANARPMAKKIRTQEEESIHDHAKDQGYSCRVRVGKHR